MVGERRNEIGNQVATAGIWNLFLLRNTAGGAIHVPLSHAT